MPIIPWSSVHTINEISLYNRLKTIKSETRESDYAIIPLKMKDKHQNDIINNLSFKLIRKYSWSINFRIFLMILDTKKTLWIYANIMDDVIFKEERKFNVYSIGWNSQHWTVTLSLSLSKECIWTSLECLNRGTIWFGFEL